MFFSNDSDDSSDASGASLGRREDRTQAASKLAYQQNQTYEELVKVSLYVYVPHIAPTRIRAYVPPALVQSLSCCYSTSSVVVSPTLYIRLSLSMLVSPSLPPLSLPSSPFPLPPLLSLPLSLLVSPSLSPYLSLPTCLSLLVSPSVSPYLSLPTCLSLLVSPSLSPCLSLAPCPPEPLSLPITEDTVVPVHSTRPSYYSLLLH